VLIRGTVAEAGSIAADLLSVMIPASGKITVGKLTLSYQLAADAEAAVHLGFTLATAILLLDPTSGILAKLLERVPSGSDVFVAGHSQGAAIATLCRSFFNYSTFFQDLIQLNYKTYVFAQPKPGNDHYADDFSFIVSNSNMGFSVINTQDWVPQVPFTFELPGDINTPNPLSVFTTEAGELIGTALGKVKGLTTTSPFSRYQPQMDALKQALSEQKLVAVEQAATDHDISILPTFNFAGAGLPIILQGTPGTNPDDPKDYFWQHHAAMYYDLLLKTFPPQQ
jgi:hypothetical protein